MMIERNRNPAGRLYNMLYGLSEVVDGLIRVISLGYLHSRLPLTVSRKAVEQYIAQQKKRLEYMKKQLKEKEHE